MYKYTYTRLMMYFVKSYAVMISFLYIIVTDFYALMIICQLQKSFINYMLHISFFYYSIFFFYITRVVMHYNIYCIYRYFFDTSIFWFNMRRCINLCKQEMHRENFIFCDLLCALTGRPSVHQPFYFQGFSPRSDGDVAVHFLIIDPS